MKDEDSIVNLSQIRTLDKRRLTGARLGTLSDELMEKMDVALKHSLALRKKTFNFLSNIPHRTPTDGPRNQINQTRNQG
jgi:hypothetical protein